MNSKFKFFFTFFFQKYLGFRFPEVMYIPNIIYYKDAIVVIDIKRTFYASVPYLMV